MPEEYVKAASVGDLAPGEKKLVRLGQSAFCWQTSTASTTPSTSCAPTPTPSCPGASSTAMS